MSSLLLTTLACHALLIAAGLGIIQMACRQRRIDLLLYTPFAWGIGVVLVYALGKMFLEVNLFSQYWHFVTAGVCVLVAVTGGMTYRKAERAEVLEIQPLPVWLNVANLVISLLILYRVAMVAQIAVLNPVIDSDATITDSYTSLSKHLLLGHDFDALLTRYDDRIVSLGVPLLNTWLGMFWDRWHDSSAAISWVFFYVFTLSIAAVVCFRLTRHLTVALIGAYLFSELPLAVHHAVRPGFHDLSVAYFFMVGVGAVLLTFFDLGKTQRMGILVLAVTAVTGLCTSKLEGAVWALWLLVLWGVYYLIYVREVPWKKVLYIQLALIVVLYGVYYLTHGLILDVFELTYRTRRLFTITYDPQALAVFLDIMFVLSTFGIWYWAIISLGFAFVVKKNEPAVTVISTYVLLLLAAIFYFCNFTNEVEHTKLGTNQPRFLLQIHALMLPIYYCFVREWLLRWSPQRR